jgi:hypothetical protein
MYEKRRGREWSPQEPSDIDEAGRGELAAASESIEPACEARAPVSKKPERDLEAGAGIEPTFENSWYCAIPSETCMRLRVKG